uniref:Uncharacterized protein n=1 Tax=Lutzomyia longipalpis TaxID=7200 RepID=A0A1B0CFA2_LUTLO
MSNSCGIAGGDNSMSYSEGAMSQATLENSKTVRRSLQEKYDLLGYEDIIIWDSYKTTDKKELMIKVMLAVGIQEEPEIPERGTMTAEEHEKAKKISDASFTREPKFHKGMCTITNKPSDDSHRSTTAESQYADSIADWNDVHLCVFYAKSREFKRLFKQYYICDCCDFEEKYQAIKNFFRIISVGQAIIFYQTLKVIDQNVRTSTVHTYIYTIVVAISGDWTIELRLCALVRFRNGLGNLLFTTEYSHDESSTWSRIVVKFGMLLNKSEKPIQGICRIIEAHFRNTINADGVKTIGFVLYLKQSNTRKDDKPLMLQLQRYEPQRGESSSSQNRLLPDDHLVENHTPTMYEFIQDPHDSIIDLDDLGFNFRMKWSATEINMISGLLSAANEYMPKEIQRQVRGLSVLRYWKGTEYRAFLLYV